MGKLAARLPENARVLDAACGTGKYWTLLRQHRLRVVGTDQSSAMLEHLNKKHPEAEVYLQSLEQLELQERFAGILCIDAMENVPPDDWPVVLGRFRLHLTEGGWLYLTVEVEDEALIEEAFQRAHDQGLPVVLGEVALEGYHYYPDDLAVRQWLQEAGFEIVEHDLGDGYRHYLCQLRAAAV